MVRIRGNTGLVRSISFSWRLIVWSSYTYHSYTYHFFWDNASQAWLSKINVSLYKRYDLQLYKNKFTWIWGQFLISSLCLLGIRTTVLKKSNYELATGRSFNVWDRIQKLIVKQWISKDAEGIALLLFRESHEETVKSRKMLSGSERAFSLW